MKKNQVELLKKINLFFSLTLLICFLIISPNALALTKPTLVSPANNAQITTKTVTFSWSHPYNDQYELKIKTSGGTLKYASGKISSKSKTVDLSSIPLTYGSTYKWYVVVYALGQEDSSEDRWFTYKFDATKPVVSAFNVTPSSVALGGSFSISYTVSDAGGSGLKQVELWRANDSGGSPSGWAQITTRALSGNGPSTGSFSNAPTAGGTYWYGVHVVDNAGNWSAEPSPRKVTVVATNVSDYFTWPVDPTNPTRGHINSGGLSECQNNLKCYWISDSIENTSTVWYDAQGFQRYNWAGHGWHLGADYNKSPDTNLPVYPTSSGIISKVIEDGCSWGNIVFVKHQTSFGIYTSMYAHVNWGYGKPSPSTPVNINTPIATVGKGDSISCPNNTYPYHLHFEIRRGDSVTNYPSYPQGYGYWPKENNTPCNGSDSSSNTCPQKQLDPNAFIAAHHTAATFSTCNTVTPQNFYQPAYNGYGAPFDLFGGNAMLVDAKCSSSDTHTIKATLGIPGNTTRIVYMKGYYYDPSISNWKQYTPTCNGTLNGDWCTGSATANITNPNISTASASAPAYFLGIVCSVQNGQWKCGCRDTACATSYWQIQGAGR